MRCNDKDEITRRPGKNEDKRHCCESGEDGPDEHDEQGFVLHVHDVDQESVHCEKAENGEQQESHPSQWAWCGGRNSVAHATQ